jgi:hypothetical protein
MNMKNAVILLMFFLCILGLIFGVYYTEFNESTPKGTEYEKTISEENGVLTISIDEIEKENFLNNLIT